MSHKTYFGQQKVFSLLIQVLDEEGLVNENSQVCIAGDLFAYLKDNGREMMQDIEKAVHETLR